MMFSSSYFHRNIAELSQQIVTKRAQHWIKTPWFDTATLFHRRSPEQKMEQSLEPNLQCEEAIVHLDLLGEEIRVLTSQMELFIVGKLKQRFSSHYSISDI
jgi:hypothetical protein